MYSPMLIGSQGHLECGCITIFKKTFSFVYLTCKGNIPTPSGTVCERGLPCSNIWFFCMETVMILLNRVNQLPRQVSIRLYSHLKDTANSSIVPRPLYTTNSSLVPRPLCMTNSSLVPRPLYTTNSSLVPRPLCMTNSSLVPRPLCTTNSSLVPRPPCMRLIRH